MTSRLCRQHRELLLAMLNYLGGLGTNATILDTGCGRAVISGGLLKR